ncbi:uncharacterized protein LOC129983710 isoform X7 [Argiope bruennichi]|uniref:uncharacterized protein LOC129983710 isoform X7 n=1 Tax=Argiope bruennichi TaxID=94029 RepID=UPI002494D82E|nr:uncharacterized protein LOC129983710 isoform X7 [Argiope bruennichi]
MEPKNHRHKPQASASLRPSISNSEHSLIATSDVSLKHLTAPALNGILQDHNTVNFKLIKTVADFTQQLSSIHEQHAEELQMLVETFRKRNAELRRERPPYQSTLFTSWEVLLQEVEVDSQVHGDIARSLGRQVGMMLLEKTFHRKIQSRKIFLHRESFETILSKAEELLNKCHQDYTEAYNNLLQHRSHTKLAEYYDMHNAYVQQLHAANGMLEHYNKETLPRLLEELEDVYTDLSDTISGAIYSAADMLVNKSREQANHYENIASAAQAVKTRSDLTNFIRSLQVEKLSQPCTKHMYNPPYMENDPAQMEPGMMLRDELVIDRLSQLPNRSQTLKQDVNVLEAQIKQLQEAVESMERLQKRSLESCLFNKANELQEDVSLKKFDLQVAHIHLAAVRAQLDLFASSKGEHLLEGNHLKERKQSTSSTSSGSAKNKWLKAFLNLKTASNTSLADKNDNDKKSAKSGSRPLSAAPGTLEIAHVFQEYTYKKITACDLCKEILRGHSRQGVRCKLCKMNVHAECQEKVKAACQPKPRLLRRQKSTSEIETKIAVPEPEEETPQSPVYGSRRHLLTAKNVRMSSVDLPDDNEKSLSSASTSPCPSPKPHRLLPTNLYVVLYNFRSRHPDEIDLKAGCIITVTDTSDADWWQGKCMGKIGYFPSKYVTKLHPGEQPLQVTHSVLVNDGESGLKLLNEQIVIQVGEEKDGIVIIRTGANDKTYPCPIKYLKEV